MQQINAPSDAIVIIHEWRLSFDGVSATHSHVHEVVGLKRVSTAGAFANVTEVRLEPGFVLPGSFVTSDHGTEGAFVEDILTDDIYSPAGWHYLPTPATRLVLSPGGRIALYFPRVLNFQRAVGGFIMWEEIGG